MTFTFLLSFLIAIAIGLYVYLRRMVITKPAKHSISTFRLRGNLPRVVFAGDSNTHGNMGHDWVHDLAMELTNIKVINAGTNADLSLTLERRLYPIIAAKPQLITILIGTNDVNATLSTKNYKRYIANGKVTEGDRVDKTSFQQSLDRMVKKLLKETRSKIALISLPLISENLEHRANVLADEYSEIIKQVALKYDLDFIDFRTHQKNALQKSTKKPAYESYFFMMQKSLTLHYCLNWSWDKIASFNGNELTHDHLHQNERSAGLLKNLVKDWVLRNS